MTDSTVVAARARAVRSPRTSGCVRIVGAGLLGSSVGHALRGLGVDVVLADASPAQLRLAIDYGAGRAEATGDDPDLIVVATPPDVVADVIERELRAYPRAVVTDVASVKLAPLEELRARGADLSRYLGSHPMAGRERGGFVNSGSDLFLGASMILTPDETTDMHMLETLKTFFTDIGFAGLTFSDPDEHDRIIAYTSQLAHLVSSSYVKSPEAQRRRGFSAGSFHDMTRVAYLDEHMWTELFMADADYLTEQLKILIGHLNEYLGALTARDAEAVLALLSDGRQKKESAGGH